MSNTYLKLDNGILEFNATPFTGKIISAFSNGKLQSEVFYKNGLKEGKEQQWGIDGTLILERFYTKGKKTGIHKSWWDNGNLKFEYHFNDKGEFHGAVKEWYADGLLLMDFNYINGKETGSQRLWKPDGSIKANYEVVNGERFGLIGLKKCYTVTIDKDEIK
jgi:antitoxin component YwqK of YwqJK toxin-antitoxin module